MYALGPMVVLGGLYFLMSEVPLHPGDSHPLHRSTRRTSSERYIYRGISLIKDAFVLAPYSRTIWSPVVVLGEVLFLLSEVPLYSPRASRSFLFLLK